MGSSEHHKLILSAGTLAVWSASLSNDGPTNPSSRQYLPISWIITFHASEIHPEFTLGMYWTIPTQRHGKQQSTSYFKELVIKKKIKTWKPAVAWENLGWKPSRELQSRGTGRSSAARAASSDSDEGVGRADPPEGTEHVHHTEVRRAEPAPERAWGSWCPVGTREDLGQNRDVAFKGG